MAIFQYNGIMVETDHTDLSVFVVIGGNREIKFTFSDKLECLKFARDCRLWAMDNWQELINLYSVAEPKILKSHKIESGLYWVKKNGKIVLIKQAYNENGKPDQWDIFVQTDKFSWFDDLVLSHVKQFENISFNWGNRFNTKSDCLYIISQKD